MNLAQYQILNNRGKKTLVFHFGAGAGFFSEYNNMLRAMAYCLLHKIRFTLYSADAGFGKGRGWQDYFEPFCDEVADEFHHVYNHRFKEYLMTTSWYEHVKSIARALAHRDTSRYRHYIRWEETYEQKKLKREYGFDYFTYELWNELRSLPLDMPVQLVGAEAKNVKELISELDRMIWRFNKETLSIQHRVEQRLSTTIYDCGMQIRGGDKFLEAEILSVNSYAEALRKYSPNCQTLFVLTDDYRCIEALVKQIPTINVETLCTEDQNGYYNDDFYQENKQLVYERIVNLLVSVDILSKCQCFIGTDSANPSHCVGIKMDEKKYYSLD